MEHRTDYYRSQMDALNEIEDLSVAVARSLEIAEEARNEGEEGFVLFFEGEALCLDGDLEKGAVLQHRAVERLPNVPFILANYAVVCSRLGRVKQALRHLNHALSIEPDDLLSLSQKSICLCKLYRDEEALEWFDKVLAIDPENDHAMRNKGVALSRLSRSSEAMACFEEVLTRNPADHHANAEKKILEDELILRKTPLGWLILWVRKKLTPTVMRILRR
jgi:tetratricopeptide (TPR) repeat protein